MENIKKFLELIYNSDNGMLYFYAITGSIALILIVLIIINIKKGKKQAKEDIDDKKVEVQSVVDEKTKEEQKVEEVIEETNISNDIPKNEDVKEIEHEDNIEVNDVDALDALYENQENKIKESKEDEIELPKVKENSDLSSESFMERLNALKNK